MKRVLLWTAFIVLAAALAALGYRQWQAQSRRVDETPQQRATPAPGVTSEDRIHYADPEPSPPPQESPSPEQAVEALPPLSGSDASLTEALADKLGREVLQQLFNVDEIARRFVVTIDNLPNRKLPRRQSLLKPVAGRFLTAGADDSITLNPDNAARYAPYVKLATDVDTRQLVALYARFSPLFQAAYAELGYPNASFNDRLLAVIDHLLAAPVVAEPIRLVRPHVFYEYADPELEALSAGQKILVRMGRANAEQVKAKLRELREALAQRK